MAFALIERTRNNGVTIVAVAVHRLISQSTAAPPNGSCCRRARASRWVDRPSGDLPAALHLRLATMLESLAAELGR